VETHTLDVAVSVVLTTAFGVESVLVAGETTSIKAKFVCIGNEAIRHVSYFNGVLGSLGGTYATACKPFP
jgi:hypothetical protein